MQIWLSLAIAVSSGLVYGACFPPYGLHWLAWVVLAPVLVVSRQQPSPARAALMTGLFSLVGMLCTVAWLPRAVSVYYQQPVFVGLAMFLGVAFSMVVPWVAAFGAVDWLISRRPGPLLPLVTAAAWVTAEIARSTFLTGNPWVLLGYSQAGDGLLVQIADLVGVYGVSFVLAASGAALADAWMARAPTWRLAPTAAVIAASLAYGAVQLAGRGEDGAAVEVGIVQGDLDLGTQWSRDLYGRNLEAYLRSSYQLLERHAPALVIWPEAAVTFFVAREPAYRASIARILGPFGATLLSGGPHAAGEHGPIRNAAFVIAPDGAVLGRYDKQKLLPFAEYFPLGEGLLRREFGRVREFTPSSEGTLLPTPAGRAGVLICNEAMFPALARQRVRDGAEVLVNISNDTWIGDDQFSAIAADMSVLRAVEQRRYLVRVSTSGPSMIVDPWGREVLRTATGGQAIASGAVRPARGMTLYARIGDAFAVACIALVLFAAVAAVLARRA